MVVGLIAVGIGVLLGVPTATQIRSFTPIFLIMPVFALGEELGWRGYLLPRLMERRSALAATLIVIAIWGAWHAPLYLPGHIWFGLPIAQILAIPPYAILLTWVYQHTKGSVLIAALFHGAMNVASMTFYAGLGNLGLWLLATLFGLAALAAIILTGPNLARQPGRIEVMRVSQLAVSQQRHSMIERYEIRVRGHLAGKLAEQFDGLTVINLPNGEAALSGPIVDQAALHGVLIKIRNLGLPLLSVNRVEPELK